MAGAGDDREHVSQRAYKIQAMLPWGFESKLASVLAVFKVPFIFLVAGIGFAAEKHLKDMTLESWYRPGNGELLLGTETGCYAHLLAKPAPGKEFIDVGADFLTTDISSKFKALDIVKKSRCNIDLDTCRVVGLEHPNTFEGGINHWIPFSLLWLIYKLVFLGIHPIDRIVLKLHGNPEPGPNYPEPLLKLLTEPHFQFCTTPMRLLVKFFFYFRYKMLPNTLLGALASMHDMRPQCPQLVYYKMSPRFGNLVYYVCIFDLLSIGAAYRYSKTKMNGQLIGRWRYRFWKLGWLVSAALLANLAIEAALRTFGGLDAVLVSSIEAATSLLSMSVSFRLGVDLLRIMTFCIFFFEGLELSFLVISILGPKLFPKIYEKVHSKFPGLRNEAEHYDHLPDDETPASAAAAPLTAE